MQSDENDNPQMPSTSDQQTKSAGRPLPHEKHSSDVVLAQEVRSLRQENSAFFIEIEGLRRQMRMAQELADELRDQRDSATKRAAAMEQELRTKGATLEQQLNPVSDELRAGKASFRVYMFKRPGIRNYRGKIEHVLTREKEFFDGVDKEVIASFIAAHLHPGTVQNIAPHSSEPLTDTVLTHPTKHYPTKPLAPTASAMTLTVSTAGAKAPFGNIAHDRPFSVTIGIDRNALGLEQGVAVGCEAQLYAQPIEGGPLQYVVGHTGNISENGMFTVSAPARTLSEGFYHLVAKLTLKSGRAGDPPLRVVEEHDAINVY